jgi:acetyl-CoA C-acetyltransferase
MAIDPRTPVLVGVGQVTTAPDADVPPAARPEPAELMALALEAAAEDCDAAPRGGPAPAGRRLLEAADRLWVVSPLGWRVPNPALAVTRRLGISPARLGVTATGGNVPEALVHHSALAVARGELDVVLVTGAEAFYARRLARRTGTTLTWETQGDDVPPPDLFGTERLPATDLEVSRGIRLPIHAYPLFENALRGAAGWTLDEHRARIGELWAGFSAVAATNPYAWIRTAQSAEEITGAGPHNRMVAFPYRKLCTSNLSVDEGAAYICCSAAAARDAGVPEDRWVFPLSGADANDHWYVSERPELHRSPAIRLAGERALALAGVGPDALTAVDLYSCFPCVVRIAARELGLAVDDPSRPLTLTGGLTFAGGPANNYGTHGIAALVQRLRREPGSLGMATGLGWYATKHAVGLYGTRPPEGGFRWESAQDSVDALPRCPLDPEATGPVEIETYTVTYDPDGHPERAIVAARTRHGARAWANVTDLDQAASLTEAEGIGRTGRLGADGTLALDG